MKRKRKSKKGKKKGAPAVAAANDPAIELVNSEREDNSGAEENDDGDDNNNRNNDDDADEEEDNDGVDRNEDQKIDSAMEIDTPSSAAADQQMNVTSAKSDGSADKTAEKSVGRVKVKLKTPRVLESQSDTDRSSLQLGTEKQGVTSDKMEDTGNSISEVKVEGSGTVSKKPSSIKIKSSKVSAGLSVEKLSDTVKEQDEVLPEKEPRTPTQESQYNKQELESSLSVIKKIMKMDAAEPFNVPVNPEALGIPDYFDVIDTPMDFGTICNRLEKEEKYKNSEDVYKDVQFIWENCYKYNNKGDYILDLMRRVKKNFMKYWTAAGLFTDQSRGSSGGEGGQGEDAGASGQGQGKSSQSKQKKKKGHGRRHKSDCLCAICVLKRRRREREEIARLAKGQSGVTDGKLAPEGSLAVESPGGEDSVSNMDESIDQDAEVETKLEQTEQEHSSGKEKHEEPDGDDEEEEEENDMEIDNHKKGKPETSEHVGSPDIQQSQHGLTEVSVQAVGQHKEQTAEIQRNIQKECDERQQKKAKMYEKFRPENPMLVSLCETLFPSKRGSLWRGPQSLFQQQSSVQTSSIHATIDTLMK